MISEGNPRTKEPWSPPSINTQVSSVEESKILIRQLLEKSKTNEEKSLTIITPLQSIPFEKSPLELLSPDAIKKLNQFAASKSKIIYEEPETEDLSEVSRISVLRLNLINSGSKSLLNEKCDDDIDSNRLLEDVSFKCQIHDDHSLAVISDNQNINAMAAEQDGQQLIALPDEFSTQAVHDLDFVIQQKMKKLERFNMLLVLKDKLRMVRKNLQEKHINGLKKFQLHVRRVLMRRKFFRALYAEKLKFWEQRNSQLNSSLHAFESNIQRLPSAKESL